LGDAIRYVQNHWVALTLFLTVAGAPLDNNITERALKKAILHRKNALLFKTLNGARVGDIFMSLIHTAELNNIPPFDYLVALQRRAKDVCMNPGDWMPWNYQATLARSLQVPIRPHRRALPQTPLFLPATPTTKAVVVTPHKCGARSSVIPDWCVTHEQTIMNNHDKAIKDLRIATGGEDLLVRLPRCSPLRGGVKCVFIGTGLHISPA
jgi:hypothetical protein